MDTPKQHETKEAIKLAAAAISLGIAKLREVDPGILLGIFVEEDDDEEESETSHAYTDLMNSDGLLHDFIRATR